MRPSANSCIHGAASAEGARRILGPASRLLRVCLYFLALAPPGYAAPASALTSLTLWFDCVCYPKQEALKQLRGELAKSLSDVETQLEALGGSASTVSHITTKTNKTNKSTKSLAAPSTIAEEEDAE